MTLFQNNKVISEIYLNILFKFLLKKYSEQMLPLRLISENTFINITQSQYASDRVFNEQNLLRWEKSFNQLMYYF